jgi:hypothetical protein
VVELTASRVGLLLANRHWARPSRARPSRRLLLHIINNADTDVAQRTLLYLRISRTRLWKASSTLMRCLADVSMNRHPKCLASSRPSVRSKSDRTSQKPGLARTMGTDLTLVLQIALVRHYYDWKVIPVLDAQNLGMKGRSAGNLRHQNVVQSPSSCLHFFERVTTSDGVDQEETFACPHVLLPHGAVKKQPGRTDRLIKKLSSPIFFLPSCIEDIQ